MTTAPSTGSPADYEPAIDGVRAREERGRRNLARAKSQTTAGVVLSA